MNGSRESQVEKRFVGLVEERNGLARKFVSPNQRGVPDRIVIWPNGDVHFVELKTRSGKLTKLQKHEQKKLTDRKCTVITVYGDSGVDDYLNAVDNLTLRTAEKTEQC